jgi:hypothetical protein
MTDLTIVSTAVRVVRLGAGEHQHTCPALETIIAGQYIRLDPSTGKFRLGNATTLVEVGEGYLSTAGVIAGETLTGFQRPVLVDLGEALDALNFGDKVWLSDTDGALADTPGTCDVVVGVVVPGFAKTTAEKLLKLELGNFASYNEGS